MCLQIKENVETVTAVHDKKKKCCESKHNAKSVSRVLMPKWTGMYAITGKNPQAYLPLVETACGCQYSWNLSTLF